MWETAVDLSLQGSRTRDPEDQRDEEVDQMGETGVEELHPSHGPDADCGGWECGIAKTSLWRKVEMSDSDEVGR